MYQYREYSSKSDVILANPNVKSVAVSGTNAFHEQFCCKYVLFFISFIFMQKSQV